MSRRPRNTSATAAVVNFALFCDETGTKPFLAAPWTEGKFTHACDGCIILRLPAWPDIPAQAHPLTAQVENLLAENPAPAAKGFEPLPALRAKEKMTITCGECYGSGAVLNEKSKPLLCPRCHGAKRLQNNRPVTVGRRRIAAHYLLRLATLPGIRVAAQSGKWPAPLRFAFDGGGEGLVSPLHGEP